MQCSALKYIEERKEPHNTCRVESVERVASNRVKGKPGRNKYKEKRELKAPM